MCVSLVDINGLETKVLTTYLLRSLYYSRPQWHRKVFNMAGWGGGANLGSDQFIGSGGHNAFQSYGGGGAGPCCYTPPRPPLCLRQWTVYFKWEGGEFYLFYRASQFYDLRSFLPFNWKKMKNCVMLDWLILAGKGYSTGCRPNKTTIHPTAGPIRTTIYPAAG